MHAAIPTVKAHNEDHLLCIATLDSALKLLYDGRNNVHKISQLTDMHSEKAGKSEGCSHHTKILASYCDNTLNLVVDSPIPMCCLLQVKI